MMARKKLTASDLKKRYGAYGNFYSQTLGGKEYPCRSILDLVSHDHTPLNIQELLDKEPCMYAVMMNPGQSRPFNEHYLPIKVKSVTEIETKRELTPAQPDVTQYQLMRIASEMGLAHIRITNLSDLRNPQSKMFIKDFTGLEKNGYSAHSLFSPERENECNRLIGANKNTPFLLGWGRDKMLLPLALQCLEYIKDRKCYGIAVNSERTLFGHPSPMLQTAKDEFLNKILEQFKS